MAPRPKLPRLQGDGKGDRDAGNSVMRGRFSYIRAGSKKIRCYRHVLAYCSCHDRPPSVHARVARTCGTRPYGLTEQGPAVRRFRPQPGGVGSAQACTTVSNEHSVLRVILEKKNKNVI